MNIETVINILYYIIYVIIWFTGLKAITIGSDFSFKDWFNYRKEYTYWYKRRETFKQYLILKQYKEIK
jgi:hypothetical protein